MEAYFEDIIGKLKDEYKPELWYWARNYVLNERLPLDFNKKKGINGIGKDSFYHVHVVVEGLEDDMLAVVRQICLLTHYTNYNENTGVNKTLITICVGEKDIAKLDVEKLPLLGNLLKFCLWTIKDGKGKMVSASHWNEKQNNYLPLDIEFEFTKLGVNDIYESKNELLWKITKSEVKDSYDKYVRIGDERMMDVAKGMLVSMVYQTGAPIDNLPACDNDNVSRYATALNVFCYNLKIDEIVKEWYNGAKMQEDGTYKEIDVKNHLSSIFCADCFETRLRGVLDTKDKSLSEYLLYDFDYVMKKISELDTINALARCEHNRWNVERLILGYSPFDEKDWYNVESCFGQERKNTINKLKKGFKHIDLCSNKDLRRLNPGDVKYDYFLMLAMPQILLSSMKR